MSNSSDVSIGQAAAASQYNNLRKDVYDNAMVSGTAAGSSNAYTLSIDSSYVAYADQSRFTFKANHTNTGAATLNVNSIGAKSIKKHAGLSLAAGDILNNQSYEVVYNSTGDYFELQTPISGDSKFGGDGSDGALTVSADTVLNPTYKIFNYTELVIDAGYTLSFGANYQKELIHVKVQGDCTINGVLSAKGAGSVGGDGGAQGLDGSDGGTIHTDCLDADSHEGTAGLSSTSPSGSGGDALATTGIASIYVAPQTKRVFYLIPGAGGGGGGGGYIPSGGGSAGSGGDITATPTAGQDGTDASGGGNGGGGGGGGAGGGMLILEVGGSLTIGAAGKIDVSGQDGARGGTGGDAISSGHGGSGGGGGGGGTGGMAIILYNGTLSNSGSIDVSGGDGGDGGGRGQGISGAGSTTCGGGGGGAGFYSGAGGGGGGASDAGSPGSSGSAGGGGGGARGSALSAKSTGGAGGSGDANSGLYTLEKNVTFT